MTRNPDIRAGQRARNTYDYSFVDWIFGPTALTPDQEPEPYQTIPPDSAKA